MPRAAHARLSLRKASSETRMFQALDRDNDRSMGVTRPGELSSRVALEQKLSVSFANGLLCREVLSGDPLLLNVKFSNVWTRPLKQVHGFLDRRPTVPPVSMAFISKTSSMHQMLPSLQNAFQGFKAPEFPGPFFRPDLSETGGREEAPLSGLPLSDRNVYES